MQSPVLDPDSLSAGIATATARKEAAVAEYEAATAELEWLIQGASLLGLDLQADVGSEAAELDELIKEPASNIKPTLRQAILAFLREAPQAHITIPTLAAALNKRGWLPDRADAQKAVSDMAALMANENQLERVGRGVYRLHPRLALGLESRTATESRLAALRDAILSILPVDRPLHTSAIRRVLVKAGQLDTDQKAYLVLQGVLSQMFMAGDLGRPAQDQYIRITDLDTFEDTARQMSDGDDPRAIVKSCG